jgi:LPS export ABC transporter protein LptC
MAVAAALLLAACNPQPQHAARATSTPSATASGMPALKITGQGTAKHPVVITGQSGNRKLYQLVTHSYSSRSAQNIAQGTFQQPTVTFYDKDGTKLTAQAPTASLQGGKQVVLSGGVHAKTSTGLTLTCDRLTYDQNSGMLHGEGNVRVTGMQGGQQQMLTGNSFTSDVKLTQMVMK